MLEIAGVALLPEWPVFLAFALAGLALNIVPGADMAFIMAASARYGRRAGILAALGIGTGAFAHIAAAVLGLSAILASSQAAFNLIKWAGAAYLLYVAVSLLRSPASGDDAPDPDPARGQIYRSAVLVNLLNPKVALFFLAFLPQFVDPASAVPQLQILALGLWFDFAGTLVNMLVAVVTAGAAHRLRGIRWIGRASRYLAATIMGALAVQLAVSSRR